MLVLLQLLPPLHVGGPEPSGPLYTHWFLDPKVAVAVFGVTAVYLLWIGPLNRRRPGTEARPVNTRETVLFLLGSLAALIALGPPIDDWSYFYFSWAHMTQHLMLMLLCVPLWLAGTPAWVFRPLVSMPGVGWLVKHLLRPIPAFLLVNLINAVWHLPVAYGLALESETWHVVQHSMFVLAGVLVWWPLMSKVPEWPRLSQPLRALYIFMQAIPTGAIGALLTYAGPLYPHYAEASVRPWGIGLKQDQELAGLQMWVGMNTIFLIVSTVIFLRWAIGEEQRDNEVLRAKSGHRARSTTALGSGEPRNEPQP